MKQIKIKDLRFIKVVSVGEKCDYLTKGKIYQCSEDRLNSGLFKFKCDHGDMAYKNLTNGDRKGHLGSVFIPCDEFGNELELM